MICSIDDGNFYMTDKDKGVWIYGELYICDKCGYALALHHNNIDNDRLPKGWSYINCRRADQTLINKGHCCDKCNHNKELTSSPDINVVVD